MIVNQGQCRDLPTMARFYAEHRGWFIFPLKPGSPLPLTAHGHRDASCDVAQVMAWWAQWPDANIGINLAKSGLMAMDVDPRNGGDTDFARLYAGLDSPLKAQSAGLGFHLFFKVPEGVRVKYKLADGIEGKWNGYVVLAPSIRRGFSGKADGDYLWSGLGNEHAAPMPECLQDVRAERTSVRAVGDLADLELIHQALAKLDFNSHEVWYSTMASVKHWQDNCPDAGTSGYDAVYDWSQQYADFSDGEFDRRWNSFDSFKPGARTLGSLLHDAGMTAAQNMVDAAAVFAAMPAAERAEAWTTTSLDPFPTAETPEEVVRGFCMKPDSAFNKAWMARDFQKVASQLAWKLGSNCEAVLRGVMLSGAADTPELRTIVLAACHSTTKWASGDAETLARVPVEVEVLGEGEQFYGAEQQLEVFRGCAFVARQTKVVTPRGELYEQGAFNAMMPAGVYTLCPKKSVTKKPWEAFVSSQIYRHPRVDDVAFRPDLAPGSIYQDEGLSFFNTYMPYSPPRREGDPAPFLELVQRMIPDARDRQILLTWMAAVVQHPGVKFQWAPVLQGWEGNGKSTILDVMQQAVGRKYVHIAQAADLANKFNAWMVGRLLITVNEVNAAGNIDVIDALKPMVSDPFIAVQGKGVDQATARNYANFMFSTNRPGAMGKAVEGRRYAVFYTAQQSAEDVKRDMPGAFWTVLHRWLDSGGYEVVVNFLATMPLVAEFNPAGDCREAPRTSSFEASKVEALGSAEQAVMEAIAEGREGFRGGFVSSLALHDLLAEIRKLGAIPVNKRRELMQTIGYDWPPALVATGGRATTRIAPLMRRPVLFVKQGHPLCEIKDGGAITRKFIELQAPDRDDIKSMFNS